MHFSRIGTATALAVAVLLAAAPAGAQVDKLLKGLGGGQGAGLSDAKIADGLKQALQVATGKAVSLTGTTDGYFRNEAIKILMPEKLKTLESGLRTVGYGSQTFDLDGYVVDKGLAGLFHVLGEQEKQIRTNPTARVTDLLKEVFKK